MSTQPPPTKTAELEIVPNSALEAITRGEIDVQIATAHKFPRSMELFKKRALEMATLDEETAASCIYSRPVGGGKFAEGLSVRTAEIVGAAYGNLRVGAMIIEQSERQVKCRGFAHDLESNFASTCEVIEATIKRDGTPYDERMRIVIAKACLAKARRDATFQVVPKALCKPIESAARAIAIGDASTLEKRRGQAMDYVAKLGIDKARVFKALGISGEAEIGLDQLTTLTGLRTAIKEGDVSIDEAFPPIIAAGKIGAAKTPVEEAAAPKPPPQTQTEPAPTNGEAGTGAPPSEEKKAGAPTLKELRTEITKKLAKINCGKSLFIEELVGREIIPRPVPFDELTQEQLLAASDSWEEIEEKLKPAQN